MLREAEGAEGRGEDVELGLGLADAGLADGDVDGDVEEGEVDGVAEDDGDGQREGGRTEDEVLVEEGEVDEDVLASGDDGVADADDERRLTENQKRQPKRKANGVHAHGKQHGPILPPAQDTSASKSTRHFSDQRRYQHPSSHTQTQTQTHGASVGVEQTQPQTLENIKMAYYWAGYYSGLYDGQQQAQK